MTYPLLFFLGFLVMTAIKNVVQRVQVDDHIRLSGILFSLSLSLIVEQW